MRNRRLRRQVDAADVDGEHALPLLRRGVCDGTAACDPGARHDDVQATERGRGLVDPATDVLLRRDIGDDMGLRVDAGEPDAIGVQGGDAHPVRGAGGGPLPLRSPTRPR